MELWEILPRAVRDEIREEDFGGLEEIRIRINRPMEFLYGDGKSVVHGNMKGEDIREILNYLSDYSIYAIQEELRQGFFTMKGGHRVGVAGRTSRGKFSKGVEGIWDINALNIRIAHENKGCSQKLIPYLRDGTLIHNTLLIAPPGVGKTTVLRDLIRLLSTGDKEHMGLKIAVVDERSEIGAASQGEIQNDLGERADVLDNCPKEVGIKLLLRSMSPQVIAMDELGGEEDYKALEEVMYCGVRILATIHGKALGEIWQKPFMKNAMEQKFFTRFIEIKKGKDGQRFYKIYDEDCFPLT